MKKLWKKIESNKLLFSLFILFVFMLFMFITNGFNGAIIKNWYGINSYIEKLTNITAYGQMVLYEILWALCLIPLILIFKNKYIFSEEKLSFNERIKIIWPMIILITAMLIAAISSAGGFIHFNVYEFLAILILCIFVGFFEEILCRGWLQNEFIERFGKTRSGVIYSIVFSGFIFGSTHIINYFAGRELAGTIIQILSAIIFGIYIGSIYFKTKDIWTCVFLHAFWDFAVFMSDLNITTSCVDVTITKLIAFQVIIMLIMDLPGILTGLKILEKVSLQKTIDKNAKFTDEEIHRSELFKKRISICQIVLVSVLSFVFILSALIMSFDSLCVSGVIANNLLSSLSISSI